MQIYNDATSKISDLFETILDKTKASLVDVSQDDTSGKILVTIEHTDEEYMFELL